MLKRVVDRFKAKGLRPVMATELEFYLMDGESETTQRPIPPLLADGGRRLANTEAYGESDESLVLPNRWEDATDAFENGEVLREYLGEDFQRVYTAVKRQEQRLLNERITDVEYEAYLGLL